MPTTSNFGWTTPADTDLVKDGAAAIRTLGNGIDTSLVDLKGGTTGQILSKASNTDLDYTWITNDQGDITAVQAGVGISIASGTGPIPVITNSSTDLITTAGDLLYGTAADTMARLGIGTAGQVLKVNSGATAPEWGAAASGSYTLINTGGTTLTGSSVTVSSIPGTYRDLYILATNYDPVNDDEQLRFYVNSDNGTKYGNNFASTGALTFNTTSARLVYAQDNGTSNALGYSFIRGYTENTWKIFDGVSITNDKTTPTSYVLSTLYGVTNITAAITSITFINDTGNFSGGTVYVYGVN